MSFFFFFFCEVLECMFCGFIPRCLLCGSWARFGRAFSRRTVANTRVQLVSFRAAYLTSSCIFLCRGSGVGRLALGKFWPLRSEIELKLPFSRSSILKSRVVNKKKKFHERSNKGCRRIRHTCETPVRGQ